MIEFDEFGRPLPPHIYGGNRARSTNPILAEMGVNTEGPLAEQAAMTAQNYDPGTYEEGGVSRHLPQQYGQAGTPYNPDEGPLSPQETAERMPQTSLGMNELIRKHLLPMNPALKAMSPEARQQALAQKREQENAAREQKRQQVMAARGGGMNGFMGGQTTPTVRNIGGFNFVSGMWRPMDPMERAKLRTMNAQADFMEQRPMIETGKQASLTDRLDRRINATAAEGEANRASREGIASAGIASREGLAAGRQAAEADQNAQAVRREFDNILGMLREREGIADEQVKANTPRFFGSAPERRPFLDDTRDPRNKDKYIRQGGSYDTMADRFLGLADRLEKLHASGVDVGPIPDDIIDYVNMLRAARAKTITPEIANALTK